MGRNQAKDKSISRHGHSKRYIKVRDRGKVAYAAFGGHDRLGNRNEEMGRMMDVNYSGGVRENRRLDVSVQGDRSDED